MLTSYLCNAPETDPVPSPEEYVYLLGDKDGFEMGLADGESLSIPAGTPLPIDHRDDDPAFTDVYPAGVNGSLS